MLTKYNTCHFIDYFSLFNDLNTQFYTSWVYLKSI